MCIASFATTGNEAPRGIRRVLSMAGAAVVVAWFLSRVCVQGFGRAIRDALARPRYRVRRSA